MESFATITATVAPLPLKDVDTDLIIPARHLTGVGREGYGEHLFAPLREQPDFFMNNDRYSNAKVLVARSNFGCGSSREHAVWALMGYGFRVIIAPSFADIFCSNSGKNGLVLVTLPEETIEHILSEAQKIDFSVTVDLEKQVVTLPNNTEHSFAFDPFRKECILRGLDDLSYILERKDEIEHFCGEQRRFYSTLRANRGG